MLDYCSAGAPGIYSTPRQTLVGAGSLRDLPARIAASSHRVTHALVVADRAFATSPAVADLVESLKALGVDAGVFSEVAGEPSSEIIAAAVAASSPNTFVIGLGGGSALDTAKFVALAVGRGATDLRSGGLADYLGPLAESEKVAPLALVPTTTGTGAEVTRIAMVTVDGTKRALAGVQLVPEFVVLDEELVAGLPGALVAATGMDALSHAIESALSRSRTSLSLQASFSAIDLLLQAIPAASADAAVSRASAQLGAYSAGLGLNAGVVLGHSIAYGISHFAGLPHGTTCAIALPYCLVYDDPSRQDWSASNADREVAKALSFRITGKASESLLDTARYMQQLASSLGLPTSLREVGISREQARQIADRCISEHPRPNNPRPFDADALHALLDAAWLGELDAAETSAA